MSSYQKIKIMHIFSALSIFLLLLVGGCVAQQQDSLPVQLPPVVIEGEIDGTCPSAEVRNKARNDTKERIQGILSEQYVASNCPCGGPGQWHRMTYLNMSDSNQQCPTNWRLITTPVRACGRITDGAACDSAIFPSNSQSYSRVCGRINAYQKGSCDAWNPSISDNPGLEGNYIEGVSLTHGPVGSRQHIWTFASALFETDPSYNDRQLWTCACTNTDFNWPYQVPSFVGDNYFCDTGNPGPGFDISAVYADDPLWDGEGCGPTSTCCQLNNPPWFCITLPQPTTDDIELRNCANQIIANEDTYISLIEIYVM